MHAFSYSVVCASLLALLPSVAAHGFVASIAIDGKTYQGNSPSNPTMDSPIRMISTIDPVKGTNNPNLACGQDAQNGALVVPANPGSKLTIKWMGGNGQQWPHNTGPLMNYLARCEGTTCDKFDASGAKWFKISEVGRKPDSNTWVQQDIMDGKTVDVTLPADLAPGDYLFRHEIIALHLATSKGGAEFYPSCTQIRVGGNGNGAPSSTVSFPGAYSEDDAGIFVPDVFNPGSKYTFPGPPVASFVAGAAADNGNNNNTGNNNQAGAIPSDGAAPPTTSGAAGPSDGAPHCQLKAPAQKRHMPRHISRVMARLLH